MDYLISSSQKPLKMKTVSLVEKFWLRKAEGQKTSWRAALQGPSPGYHGSDKAHAGGPCAPSFQHQVSLPGLVVPPLSCAQQQVPRTPAVAMTP